MFGNEVAEIMNSKQLVTIMSASLIIIGVVLLFTWSSPVAFFISVGMIVFGIILFLLYITFSVAGWADKLVSGEKTEITFSYDPNEEDAEDDEEKE